MTKKPFALGMVMDPLDAIKPHKDTSFAMLLEAQRRGWQCHYFTQQDMYLQAGEVFARRKIVEVTDRDHDWFRVLDTVDTKLTELDCVLMRKDPPVDADFVYATHLLQIAADAGLMVVNNPAALRDCNEKLYAQHFPQCCAPTLVASERARLKAFITEQQRAVVKPLDGMGGASIFVLAADDPNINVSLDTLTLQGQRQIMAQAYLPAIAKGDKRILLIDGEPIPYALARIPAAGETRGNLAAGGRGEGVALSDRDRWICEQVAPDLRQRGLRFVGLDVIGDYLTEINVTSPTCVRELDTIYGLNIAGTLFDALTN
ncbi:MAG TPA: glutathione synthase [Gammaproteobacteria bacterium]|nr:glutathione synthase [Gammaproteobacteria bacterium]